MATFVGAEYLIANVLIAFKKISQQDTVTLEQLSEAGIYIQQKSLDEGVNAIFLSSSEQMVSAVYDFCDYFEFNSVSNSITIVKTKNIEDLESRFMGYLPFKVLKFLVSSSNKFAEEKEKIGR